MKITCSQHIYGHILKDLYIYHNGTFRQFVFAPSGEPLEIQSSKMATGQLVGRLALVTGAGSGIGRAICQVFAKEGARIAAVDVNEQGLQETIGSLQGEHHAFPADVSSSSSVNDLLKNVKTKFSDIPTVAVNCAGITRDGYMLKMSEDKFDQVMDINLKGTFLVSQAVAKLITSQKAQNGAIVNISSISGKLGNAGQTNYSASKAGVIGLTKAMAKELGGFGIRCNAVLPGLIDTPMIKTIPENIIQMAMLLTPIARPGKPEEVAKACLFLASEQSSYITGTTLEVTGGFGM